MSFDIAKYPTLALVDSTQELRHYCRLGFMAFIKRQQDICNEEDALDSFTNNYDLNLAWIFKF